jgi:hypothetical protein
MESLAESAGENIAVDEFNNFIGDRIGQKDPYKLKTPQGLSERDAAVLKRCRRRAYQLDHNAVLCYCCPCFFGLNTALCMYHGVALQDTSNGILIVGIIPFIGPICANLLSGRVVRMAEEADLPATLTAKMSANITFDFLVIPFHSQFLNQDLPPALYRCSLRGKLPPAIPANTSGCINAIPGYPTSFLGERN